MKTIDCPNLLTEVMSVNWAPPTDVNQVAESIEDYHSYTNCKMGRFRDKTPKVYN